MEVDGIMMLAEGAAGDRRYKTAARTRTREGPPDDSCPFTVPTFMTSQSTQ